MSQEVSVLDFGSGKITVLIGKRGINNTLVLSGIGESNYAGFCNGEFFDPGNLSYAVAHAINAAEAAARTTIEHLIVGVPGEFTTAVCQDVSISLTKKRKVLESDLDALHEMGNNFKNNPEYTLINSQPIYYTLDDGRKIIQPVGLTSNKLGGHISYVLAENSFIDKVDNLLKELNIESYDYMSSLVAESMFLFDDNIRDRFVVFIDSGRITTSVAVVQGDGILAQYNVPMGGGHITNELAYEFGIGYTQAENLKHKIALNLSASDDDVYTITTNRSDTVEFSAKRANDAVSSVIWVIADTITKSLKECSYDYPDYIPYHLTGGGIAYIKGASELLAKYLKRPVEVVAPSLPQSARPHLSSSLGLLDMAIRITPQQTKTTGFFKKLFRFGKKRGGNQ